DDHRAVGLLGGRERDGRIRGYYDRCRARAFENPACRAALKLGAFEKGVRETAPKRVVLERIVDAPTAGKEELICRVAFAGRHARACDAELLVRSAPFYRNDVRECGVADLAAFAAEPALLGEKCSELPTPHVPLPTHLGTCSVGSRRNQRKLCGPSVNRYGSSPTCGNAVLP